MRRFGLNTYDLVFDAIFVGMWVGLAIGDVRGGDWIAALVHFWTGVIVAAFVARQQYRGYQLKRSAREYRKLSEDTLRAMLAITAFMQQQHTDPSQFFRHLKN